MQAKTTLTTGSRSTAHVPLDLVAPAARLVAPDVAREKTQQLARCCVLRVEQAAVRRRPTASRQCRLRLHQIV
ncbi:hypothetical protein EON66_02245 [archaeon]|nr:MAG: hypothetical protein EON66_02245 [archaeon]